MGSAFSFGHPGFAWQGGRGKVHFDTSACEDAVKEFFAAMTGSRGSSRGKGPRPGAPNDPWSFVFGGPGPWGPPWGGGHGPHGRHGHGRRHPKARRGDVRAAILSVLADQPMNGYQIIQEITERSHGVWKPSPGSVYPTLQQLEDEGLVAADKATGRRTFSLTAEGRTYADEHAEELAAPWEAFESANDDDGSLKPVIGQVAAAMWQVMAAGTSEQQDRARQAMVELRRQLYAILNDDDVEEGTDEEDVEEGGTP